MQKFWIYIARKLHQAAIADLEREDRVEELKKAHAARLAASQKLLAAVHGPSRALHEECREVIIRVRAEDYDMLLASLENVSGFLDNAVAHVIGEVRQAIKHEAAKHDQPYQL